MTEQLVLRLAVSEQEPMFWMIWSEAEKSVIASGELAGADGLNSLTERAGQRPVTVLVPTSSVLLKWVTLPARASRKALNAIPYMLEDELSGDIDTLFFAHGPRAGDQQAVAIVDVGLMQQWLGWLQQAGLQCEKMLPDVLALPNQPPHWSLMEVGKQLLIRQDSWQGLQGEPEWLLMAVEHAAKQQPEPIQLDCYTAGPDRQLANITVNDKQVDMPLAVLARGALDSRFNLLQRQFKPRQKQTGRFAKWRLAAGLAALALLVNMLGKGIEIHQLHNQQQQLQTQIKQRFEQTFPNAGAYRNLRAKMTDLMARLQGDSGGASMLAMLVELSDAFKVSQIKPQTLQFNHSRAELRIQAVAKDFSALDKFKTAAEAAGFSVQQGAINNKGNQVVGSLTLRS